MFESQDTLPEQRGSFPFSIEIGAGEIELFRSQGFLVIPEVIGPEHILPLRERFPLLFAGKFDTGVYPDEWYWREGMSLPDVTRHMANAWKSDLTIAQLVLSEQLARTAAVLADWHGARLGQDTIWWKLAKTKAIALHQDSSFMDFLIPAKTVTCWITLDQTFRDAGTLEYIPGSHQWPLTELPDDFHAPGDYRARMRVAAAKAAVIPPEPVYIEIPAGSVVFHAGEIWHGSGPNETSELMRRSIGIHYVPVDAQFSDRTGGYIYRRYQLTGSSNLDESFFPVLWSDLRPATSWISNYLKCGKRC